MNLKQLLFLKAAGGPSGPSEWTIVGNPVSFRTKYAEPMKLVIPFTPVQSGSGDPSPSNVRPITGWTGANISVSPTQDAQDATVYPITFSDDSGTVYGGTLTVNADGTGELVVDMAMVTLTDLSQLSAYATDTTNGSYARIAGTAGKNTQSEPCVISSNSVGIAYDDRNTKFSDVDRVFLNNSGYVTIRASKNRSISSVEDLFSLFNGGQFVYKIEPTVTTLSPGVVKSIIGQNHVWTDTNGENTVTYIK